MHYTDLFRLIRPRQWVKNVFVFFPIFFGGHLLSGSHLLAALVTFAAFCLAASSVYCFNDVIDVEADRRHPVKRTRPVAAGKVSVTQAYVLMGLMIALALALVFLLPVPQRWSVGGIILLYWLMNLAYCGKLKEYAIVDVCVISFGFVLRVLSGGEATGTYVSHWLVLMTFLLTLFLSFCKRRDDVIRMNRTGEAPRKNTIRYNLTFINQAVTITASVMLVCYILYTLSPEVTANFHTHYLYLTSAFVLIGLLRYIQLTVVDEKSGDPTKVIFRDRFIQLDVLALTLSFFLIIYFL